MAICRLCQAEYDKRIVAEGDPTVCHDCWIEGAENDEPIDLQAQVSSLKAEVERQDGVIADLIGDDRFEQQLAEKDVKIRELYGKNSDLTTEIETIWHDSKQRLNRTETFLREHCENSGDGNCGEDGSERCGTCFVRKIKSMLAVTAEPPAPADTPPMFGSLDMRSRPSTGG